MNMTQGQCARCGDTNSHNNLACDGCGSRLPWADALDDARRKQIAASKDAAQAQQTADAAQKIADKQARAAAQQAYWATQPRKGEKLIPGICPSCGKKQLVEFRRKERDDGSLQSAACCLGCFFFPFLLVAPFLAKRGKTTIHRRCLECNHQWQI